MKNLPPDFYDGATPEDLARALLNPRPPDEDEPESDEEPAKADAN